MYLKSVTRPSVSSSLRLQVIWNIRHISLCDVGNEYLIYILCSYLTFKTRNEDQCLN